MTTVVCCTANTDHLACSIRQKLQSLGYNECFEERIQAQELLISVRLETPPERALVLETFKKAGGLEIATWEEQAAG